MANQRNGFKDGKTFWMNLVSVLDYRFDSLHHICEGVCSMLLSELFGSGPGRMNNMMRIRRLDKLKNCIKNIEWPQRS